MSAPYRYEGTRRYSANLEDDRCGDGSIRGTQCLGVGDDSPAHSGAHYDSRCNCCWLNITHTVRVHAVAVGSQS